MQTMASDPAASGNAWETALSFYSDVSAASTSIGELRRCCQVRLVRYVTGKDSSVIGPDNLLVHSTLH